MPATLPYFSWDVATNKCAIHCCVGEWVPWFLWQMWLLSKTTIVPFFITEVYWFFGSSSLFCSIRTALYQFFICSSVLPLSFLTFITLSLHVPSSHTNAYYSFFVMLYIPGTHMPSVNSEIIPILVWNSYRCFCCVPYFAMSLPSLNLLKDLFIVIVIVVLVLYCFLLLGKYSN